MIHTWKLLLATGGLTLLAGCIETGSVTTGGGTRLLAEERCREAVAAQTNPDVLVLGSTPLASGEYDVRLSVGGTQGPRAPYQCIGAPDGSTRAIMFLGSEGAA